MRDSQSYQNLTPKTVQPINTVETPGFNETPALSQRPSKVLRSKSKLSPEQSEFSLMHAATKQESPTLVSQDNNELKLLRQQYDFFVKEERQLLLQNVNAKQKTAEFKN